jgi:hypothetical protein
MRLSHERPATRWALLSAMWILVACVATFDALAMRDYVDLLDASSVLPTTGLPLARSAPADYADAQTWVQLAVGLSEHRGWRVRATDIDNAPRGREVHWSSAFVHLVAVAGYFRRAFTDEPVGTAIERALAWFNLPLFLGIVILFSSLVARTAGGAAGVLIGFGMLGHSSFYAGFAPNYVDHHGILSAASFGTVLGAVLMGGGWFAPDDRSAKIGVAFSSYRASRRAACLSAICGAIGMWISAPSVIPTIAFVGIAGAIAAFIPSKRNGEEGTAFAGDLWRLWGRVGGSVALVAYLVEYAPSHLGMRLEVNHPLYAVAWVAGAELVAVVGDWRINGIRLPRLRTGLALLGLLAAPFAILIGGPAVFALRDPRLLALHTHIAEFVSLRTAIQLLGRDSLNRFIVDFALLVPIGLMFTTRVRARSLIAFGSLVVLGASALA